MRHLLLLGLLLAVTACSGESPQPPETCQPATCSSLGADCGAIADGCGGTLQCGDCIAPETCGGRGVQNVCDICLAESDSRLCAQAGKNCGLFTTLDKCGAWRTPDCGVCPSPQGCGLSGNPNVCGTGICDEDDTAICQRLDKDCGPLTARDVCGLERKLHCGGCVAPATCGGGGIEGRCGCTPESDATLCATRGFNCGSRDVVDGCGALRTIDCGQCIAPAVCGGAGTANVCGKETCSETDTAFCLRLGKKCGPVTATDVCGVGRTVHCGSCVSPLTCGGGGVDGQCGCTPEGDTELCQARGFECGSRTLTDRCGKQRSVNCGGCTAPMTCVGGSSSSSCSCTPESNATLCASHGRNCGSNSLTDRCGATRTVNCGSCASPSTCGGGGTPGVCGCPGETDAQLCARAARNCGSHTITDLCGNPRTVNCGTCTSPQTCGGSGSPGVCGICTPESDGQLCARAARNCGSLTTIDSCGASRTVACGTCTSPQTCGGAGIAGQCGVGSTSCDNCLAPTGCGLGGVPSVCGCTPITCAALGRTCGKVPDDCGGELDCGPCADGEAPPPYCIRVMAANTTSGNMQSYDPGHGLRIFQGLRPDVILIQEFNFGDKSPAAIRSMVESTFGAHFWHFREPVGNIPNGVISRFPILEAGEWDDSILTDRDYVWARLDVPGPRDLWAISLHLHTKSLSRVPEATELVEYIRQKVPPGDFVVIGGDLNTGSRTEACFTTLSQVVVTVGAYPVDQLGDGDTNKSRKEPYDWVLASPALNALETPVHVGANTFPSGLVFDSRVYNPLSDVAPVLRDDSDAVNMQHMAVVRDFCLPLQ